MNKEAIIGSRRTIAQTIPCLPGHHDGVGADVVALGRDPEPWEITLLFVLGHEISGNDI